jgi:hypothetical protein
MIRTLLLSGLVTLIGCGQAGAGEAATAQRTAPSVAPASWMRYAELLNASVATWLGEDSATALRLRAYLHANRPDHDRPTAPLSLKLWVDPDGVVTRADFPAFAHQEPNDDLRAILVGRKLPSSPPKDMLLPLRLEFQLDPALPSPS